MSASSFTYVVEHMEDDEPAPQSPASATAAVTVPEWVELEYRHMLTLAGPSSTVLFTNLSKPASAQLAANLAPLDSTADDKSLAQLGVHTEGVLARMGAAGVPLERVCLLDPKAEKELAPEDGDGRFEWFLFGGILGDDPPRDRTAELRKLGFPNRHLGPVQMTTDTALGATKMVVQDKVPLQEIPYVDFPTIVFNAKESVEMPFRYIVRNGQPVLPVGMREHLQKDLDRGFDF